MSLISGKALWSVVCGTNVLPSDEVVGEELEAATTHLKNGLLHFQKFTPQDHQTWSTKVKLKENQKIFVERLGKMLNLSSSQSWELFQLYLQQEYRGSSSELMSALSSYRSESRLLHHIYSFHLTDPLHLLSCRTHLLASAAKRSHPYQKLFRVYIQEVLDPDKKLGSGLIGELELVHECVTRHRDRHHQNGFYSFDDEEEAKTAHTSALDYTSGNTDLPLNAEYLWLAGRLALAKHLLATLLIYYAAPHRHCPPESVYSLLKLAQGGGVCGGAVMDGEGTGQAALGSLLRDIDALHALLLTLLLNPEADTRNHVLCEAAWRDKLEPLMSGLGSRPGHLPPLLAWSVIQGRQALADSAGSNGGSVSSSTSLLLATSGSGVGGASSLVNHYSKMAQRALRGGVLAFLHNVLHNQAILTDTLLSDLSCSIVYALVCVAGAHLNLEQLGSEGGVSPSHLAVTCLACPLPAQLFWAEEGGGAGLLLPDALEVFPHRPTPLLALCTALAKAGPDSCDKVVELLSEIPSMTWQIADSTLAGCCSEVGGAQVVSHTSLQLLQGLALPPHTSGTVKLPTSGSQGEECQFLVQWHLPTNVWQLLLSALHALDTQISSGVAVSEWLVELVEETLKLVASIIKSKPSHLTSLTHIVQQALTLTLRLSSVLEPRYSLVRWLLAVAAQVAEELPQRVWDKLDKCSLLPALPASAPRAPGETNVQYYRCGTLRSLVCGTEAASGSYPALRSFCRLLSCALKADLTNTSVRGGVVFVVREVVPAVVQQWSYTSAGEKVEVLEAVMEVLHHTLEQGKADEDIAAEVGHQLCGRSGGHTLRAVLEAGATLEASLDAPPAQWPHATHATALARTAHLALSILHRLVLVHCSGPDNCPSKQRLRDLLAGDQRPHGAGQSVRSSALSFHGPPHLALTVAQFVHHRLNSRLPYLALRTLTKLAQELGVPLVACLGSEAEVIRELLLNRLDAATEDTRVKVAITRLLTAAVSSQPGLLRAFLSPPDNLMDTLTEQLDTHSKCFEASSVELVGSCVELVAALWSSGHAAAITTLRTNELFWAVLLRPLSEDPDSCDATVLHHTLRLLALEHFVAYKDYDGKLANGLAGNFKDFMQDNFSCLTKRILTACEEGRVSGESLLLVQDWRDLTGVLLAAYTSTMDKDTLRCVADGTLSALTDCLSCPEESSLRQAGHLLADAFLSVNKHAPQLGREQWYWEAVGRVVEGLRAGLLQTPAPTQLRLLTALLLALQQLSGGVSRADEKSSCVMGALCIIVEQHCSLANLDESAFDGPKGFSKESDGGESSLFCSSSAVLQVACGALHLCLLLQPPDVMLQLLQHSHLVPALVHAATVHMQSGAAVMPLNGASPASVSCSLVRLLALLAASDGAGPDLSSQSLATSLALTIANTQQTTPSDSLSDVVWCALSSLRRQGAAGVEGCVAIAAVHLNALVQALQAPHHQPDLAHAAASLTAALAPHYRLWVASHQHSYRLMVEATASSMHMTTHLVRLRGLLVRKMPVASASTSTDSDLEKKSSDNSKDALTPSQVQLVNRLLQVLLACLRCLRLLGPDLVELLCSPGVDLGEWLPALLQCSFRRATAAEPAQPNLGTLTALLDVCTTHLIKEKSQKKDSSSVTSASSPSQLSSRLLTACGEEALLLLLTQATLSLLNPDTSSREARDIRTWLSDEMNTFFNAWLGRRSSSSASPLPGGAAPQHTPSSRGLDRGYLRLMQHLVSTLCQAS